MAIITKRFRTAKEAKAFVAGMDYVNDKYIGARVNPMDSREVIIDDETEA